MITVLCYPRCTTCQRAIKWLDDQHISYIFRNIATENPSYEELKHWVKQSGLTTNKFFNTSGLMYKELHLKDKIKTMTEDEQLRILSSNGMLIKRPVLISNTQIFVGFKETEWSTLKV